MTETIHLITKITYWLGEITCWLAKSHMGWPKSHIGLPNHTLACWNHTLGCRNHCFRIKSKMPNLKSPFQPSHLGQIRNLEFQITISNCEIKILTCRIEITLGKTKIIHLLLQITVLVFKSQSFSFAFLISSKLLFCVPESQMNRYHSWIKYTNCLDFHHPWIQSPILICFIFSENRIRLWFVHWNLWNLIQWTVWVPCTTYFA